MKANRTYSIGIYYKRAERVYLDGLAINLEDVGGLVGVGGGVLDGERGVEFFGHGEGGGVE